ncbi:(+)-neomenthol dehydrogenase-like [Andrographis paniculata]|uniref:(+)-neomenthol dehydrogenase-like n=1 Tax=Andrographis paniculata TaxID=175694 RepID=UPI0021E937AC|nr:(+)-neomenthol dehydrogenase-like [Andrographis paniculata]
MAGATKRYAVVTGANKGLGLEICRQLASQGITVVLTSRDENRGLQAVEKLTASGLSDHVIFHRLDVAEEDSATALSEFIKSQFGKLDILVNNAAVTGSDINWELLDPTRDQGATGALSAGKVDHIDWSGVANATYDLVAQAIQTNYYGTIKTTKALLPLLSLSNSPRIVNISSIAAKLEHIPSEWAKGILSNEENLTEERIDKVVSEFVEDFKEGRVKAKGWPNYMGAYIVSKAAINAYTKLLAKQYPTFRINSVCPGYIKTDMNNHTGTVPVNEGAAGPVKLALLPDDGPSGCFFVDKDLPEL